MIAAMAAGARDGPVHARIPLRGDGALVAERVNRGMGHRSLRFVIVVIVASVAHVLVAGLRVGALGGARAVGLGGFDGGAGVGRWTCSASRS